MLAPLLAAIAVQLTPSEVDRAVMEQPQMRGYERQVATTRRDACEKAKFALQLAGDLQRAVDQHGMLVLVPDLISKLQPGQTGAVWYDLSDDDLKVIRLRLHEMETEAKVQQVSCEG